MRIRPIKNERDYRAAVVMIDELWDAPTDSDDADTLDVLCTLVDAYEQRVDPIPLPGPIEAILFELDQKQLDRSDLQRILGVGRGRVSEILSGKRGLSIGMIRKLSAALGIPAEILIQPTRRSA